MLRCDCGYVCLVLQLLFFWLTSYFLLVAGEFLLYLDLGIRQYVVRCSSKFAMCC